MTDEATIAAAERTARHWTGPQNGAIAPGSDDHKTLFCRMLLDTHNPYRPAVIGKWPGSLDAPDAPGAPCQPADLGHRGAD